MLMIEVVDCSFPGSDQMIMSLSAHGNCSASLVQLKFVTNKSIDVSV